MEEKKIHKIKEYGIGIAIFSAITLLFYMFLHMKYTLIYGINDDWTLYMVISGSYLGTPEPHVNYMLYPLAWFLSKLYGITSAIPWYGLMLHGSVTLCGMGIFFGAFKRCKLFLNKIMVGSLVLLIFYISNIRMLVAIQYTQVAAMCGATAVFWFLIADTKDKNWKEYLIENIPTILYALLSLNIRENAAYMCLPMAGMIFIGKWYLEERKMNQEVIKKYAGFVIVLLGTMSSVVLCHKIAYSSPEWKEYVNVNNIWTECVDYYGFPSYEDMEDIIKSNGMTKEDYQVSITYQTFYNGEMPYSEFLRIMADKAKEKYDEKNTFPVKLETANKSIVQYLTDDQIQPQNTIMLLLFMLVMVALIWRKDKDALLALAFYLFGRFFAWYYLLFAGRFPLRIPQGLLIVDLVVMLGFFLYFELYGSREYRKSKVATVVVYVVSLIAFGFILKNGVYYLELSQGYVDIYQDRWYGIKEYCVSNPENEYVLTAGSQTLFYFSDSVWETRSIGKKQNYYLNSNFDSPSPNYYSRMGVSMDEDMAEIVIDKESSYWIFENGTFHENIPIAKYYKYRYDTFSYELMDTFSTETSTFEVYKFSK